MASISLVRMLLLALCLLIFGNGINKIKKVEGQKLATILENNQSAISQNQLSAYGNVSISNSTLRGQNKRYDAKSIVAERVYLEGQTLNGSRSDQQDYGIVNHWAALQTGEGQYYGAYAKLNVFGLPTVGPDQSSATLISLVNGYGTENLNVIKAGWHVHPTLYGDHDTHFFVHWMADANAETGCYNMLCEGFVQMSTEYVPGTVVRPLSTYNGEQRFLDIKISKDQITGDWWLHSGPKADIRVGYWPKSLFTTLEDSAAYAQWGGAVVFHKTQRSPPMGSGHFPIEGYGKAASMLAIKLVSLNGAFYDPNYFTVQDKKVCYQVNENIFGHVPFFGGPGGCTD